MNLDGFAHLPRLVPIWRERGAVAVEMAIVTPLLVAMIIGIIDFSRVFNAEIQLSQAAREGVRIASLADGTATGYKWTDVQARAILAAPYPAFGPTPPTVNQTDIVMCPNTQELAQVTVTYAFKGIWFSFEGAKSLSQTAVMICGA